MERRERRGGGGQLNVVFLAVVLEPRCGYAENETDMTQSEAGKQAQPALPGVTIWPCLMAKQPAGCTHTVIHTHMLVYLVSLLASVFVFVSQKLTCFGCKRRQASGKGTSKTGRYTHSQRQHMVIGHSVVVLKCC